MKIKGFKAFDKGMTCRGFQYKEGETYITDNAELCNDGFHFCKEPLDVLNYYDLIGSEFHEVEGSGKSDSGGDDSKVAVTEIKIGAKLTLKTLIDVSIDFVMKKARSKDKDSDSAKLASSGDYAQLASSGDSAKLASSGYSAQLASSGDSAKLASSGYSAQLASSGDSAQLASSGDSAKLEVNGEDSVGACVGIESKIKGKKGNWITLAEWKYCDKKERQIPVCVKSAKIDGKKLEEDAWYELKDKKFVKVED